MVESGGPSAHAGIRYQNSIAALYLGRLLDCRPRNRSDEVSKVRVEPPNSVGDLVVVTGDGSSIYIQAKRDLRVGSGPWIQFWRQAILQIGRDDFLKNDRILIVLGVTSSLATGLKECCERARTSVSYDEYQERLTQSQRRYVSSIVGAVHEEGKPGWTILELLSRIAVEILPEDGIERDYAPLWMPEGSSPPDRTFRALRDLIAAGSETRVAYEADALSAQLASLHGIRLTREDPSDSTSYRTALLRRSVLEVPGTRTAIDIGRFVWPAARMFDPEYGPEFDDATVEFRHPRRAELINLATFPNEKLDKLVVVGGPGLGKSALMVAIAASAANRQLLPAIISIPEFAQSRVSLLEFLNTRINESFHVKIDWFGAAKEGLCVPLLDGLDEVSTQSRMRVLEELKLFSARFPKSPWALTVRDVSALPSPPASKIVQLEPLGPEYIQRFLSSYLPHKSDVHEAIISRFYTQPDLIRLTRLPLFLVLLLSMRDNGSAIPTSRVELLDSYVDLLFHPEQFKKISDDQADWMMLRPIAEEIAFIALEKEEITVRKNVVSDCVSRLVGAGKSMQSIIDRLLTCGILRRVSPVRYSFPFPIVQEFLAGCHLARCRPDEISMRMEGALKRPWAQALQFALEQHPNPSPVVGELLAQQDDAFGTQLRMIARCACSGMFLTAPQRTRIERDLARFWVSGTATRRMQVGQLIADGFCRPLSDEIRTLLFEPDNLWVGGADILAATGDAELRLNVLRSIVEGAEKLPPFREVKPWITGIEKEVFSLFVRRAKKFFDNNFEQHGIGLDIGELGLENVPTHLWKAVADDEGQSDIVRLATLAASGEPIDTRYDSLIEATFARAARYDLLHASFAVHRMPCGPAFALDLLRSDLPDNTKYELLTWLPAITHAVAPASEWKCIAYSDGIPEWARTKYLIKIADELGDREILCELLRNHEELEANDIARLFGVVSFIGDPEVFEKLTTVLSQRDFKPSERARFIGAARWMDERSITTGIGSMLQHSLPARPDAEELLKLMEKWGSIGDYNLHEAVEINTYLANLGSRSAPVRLMAAVLAAIDNESFLDIHHSASVLSQGIRQLTLSRLLLPIDILERLAQRLDSGKSQNGFGRVVKMIAAHGGTAAFESLFNLYHSLERGPLKEATLDALDLLAGGLGMRLYKSGNQLRLRPPQVDRVR